MGSLFERRTDPQRVTLAVSMPAGSTGTRNGWALSHFRVWSQVAGALLIAVQACSGEIHEVGIVGGAGSKVPDVVETTGGAPASGSSGGAQGESAAGTANGGAGSSTTGGRCGDPAVMQRYAACTIARDAQTCATLGGTWAPLGTSSVSICLCPTGDTGCSCTRTTDCVALCLGAAPSPTGNCSEVTVGQCIGAPTSGCWCVFGGSLAIPVPLCW
jgi:hypothetical protein